MGVTLGILPRRTTSPLLACPEACGRLPTRPLPQDTESTQTAPAPYPPEDYDLDEPLEQGIRVTTSDGNSPFAHKEKTPPVRARRQSHSYDRRGGPFRRAPSEAREENFATRDRLVISLYPSFLNHLGPRVQPRKEPDRPPGVVITICSPSSTRRSHVPSRACSSSTGTRVSGTTSVFQSSLGV